MDDFDNIGEFNVFGDFKFQNTDFKNFPLYLLEISFRTKMGIFTN